VLLIIEMLWLVCSKWMDAHMQKYARLRLFPPKSDLHQTFNKCRAINGLYSNLFKLRRLDQETMLW